jgi:hypothetical protein
MGALDWLRRLRMPPPDPSTWEVRHEGGRIVVADGKKEYAFSPGAARAIRVVPLGVGPGHGHSQAGSGWQVAVHHDRGDVPIGRPLADWRAARDFAHRLCAASGLSVDELTERLFSRVGQVGPPRGGRAG